MMSQLACYFSRNDEDEIYLILFGKNRDICYHVPEKVIIHKPNFNFLNSPRSWSTIKTILFIRNTIKRIEPTTILSFGEIWNNLVVIALLGLKYPIYISDRSQPNKDLGIIHNFLRNMLYPKATGLIVQTSIAEKTHKVANRNNNIKVIPNPIRKIERENFIKKEKIVLTIGRLIPTKNIDMIIKTFCVINMPQWKLVIIGNDSKNLNLRKQFKDLISEFNAQDKVDLVDKVKNIDIFYLKSSIFAFASSSEGFPNVIGEAMAAGLPVIAFDCIAGPADMIRDGKDGFLIPLYDYETFRNRLKLLMVNEDKRNLIGESAKKSIKRYSIDSIGEQYYNFITKVN